MTKGKSVSNMVWAQRKKCFEKPKNVQFSYLGKGKAKSKPMLHNRTIVKPTLEPDIKTILGWGVVQRYDYLASMWKGPSFNLQNRTSIEGIVRQ